MKLLFFILSMNLMAQEVIDNKFFRLQLAKSTTSEKMNSLNEEFSSLDVFKITNSEDEQLKYLIYLMSNKSNVKDISESHLNEYVKEIGNVKVLSSDSFIFKKIKCLN